MRQVLLAVPGSVLWLLRFGTSNAAELNLAREAVRLGLDDPARILFTDTASRPSSGPAASPESESAISRAAPSPRCAPRRTRGAHRLGLVGLYPHRNPAFSCPKRPRRDAIRPFPDSNPAGTHGVCMGVGQG